MPGMIEMQVAGDVQLTAALRQISDEMVDKIAPAGVRGYLRVVAKGIKSEVPSNMKDLRRSIGWRFVKMDKRTRRTIAKAGPAVGVKRGKLMTSLKKRIGRPGVGISINNYFWYVRGTDERIQETTNRRTGASKAHPIVKDGFRKSRSEALSKFRELARAEMNRRAKKIRAKSRAAISRKLVGA